ncbi:MAG TPA: type II CAAX endopeptidase family protein [Blastocatellia bacterium]|nr:type II CAAX endopeptidase family protein [Blastocatellia bacterium]
MEPPENTRRFRWLGLSFGLLLVAAPLLIVIMRGDQGTWAKWLGFVAVAGGVVFIYMLMGDPAFVARVQYSRLGQSTARAALAAAGGALFLAIAYAILTGAAAAEWRWLVLVVVIAGTVALFSVGRASTGPRLTDALAIVLVWLPVEFKLLPDLVVPPFGHRGVNLVKLLMAPFLIWCAIFIRRWPNLGYDLYLKLRDVRAALIAFACFAATGLPLALVVHFVRPSSHLPSLPEMIGRATATWAFVALPEELLFRGLIQNGLMNALGRPVLGLVIASMIFGAAHLDNPPKIWRYALLASLAGLAYGWAYMKTRSSMASSIVHTLVDWVWGVFFRG